MLQFSFQSIFSVLVVAHVGLTRDASSDRTRVREGSPPHTSLRTLLVSAQRVCTSWRDVIAHSPRLQRKLFFTPSPPDDARAGLEFNSLLVSSFPHFFPHPSSGPSTTDLPPFLPAQGNGRPLGACMRLHMTDMRYGRARHLAFTRRGTSWRRMVVAWPAPRRVARALDTRAGWQQRGEPAWEVVEVEGGVRMGELFGAFFAVEVRSGSGWVAFGEVAWGWPGGGGVSPGLGGLGRVDLVLTKAGEWSLWLEKGQRAHVCWGPGKRAGPRRKREGWRGPRQETFGSSEWQYRCEEFDPTGCLAWP